MNGHKPFFAFLGVLVVLTIAFGVYVSRLTSCAAQAEVFPVADCQKLYLAFGVLFAVAVMLALGAAFYALVPPPAVGDAPGKQIFDTLAKSLLPVVTLVLGYYFGSAQVATTQGRPAATASGDAPASAAAAGETASGAAARLRR